MRNVKNSEPIRALRYAVRLDHRLERLQSLHAFQPVSPHDAPLSIRGIKRRKRSVLGRRQAHTNQRPGTLHRTHTPWIKIFSTSVPQIFLSQIVQTPERESALREWEFPILALYQ